MPGKVAGDYPGLHPAAARDRDQAIAKALGTSVKQAPSEHLKKRLTSTGPRERMTGIEPA